MSLAYFLSSLTWIAFLIGAIVGSFLNVCIYRIPEQSFWLHARSVCFFCKSPIPFYYNIPLVSYLLLRGKSVCCEKSLPIQYPLVELLTGLIFVLCYWHFPFVVDINEAFKVDQLYLLRFLHATIFACLMIVCSVIDLNHMIIPDVISIPMILLSPVVVYFHPDLDWKSSLIGVAAGGGLLYLVAWLYWVVRRDVGMGFGDVKLLAAIGGWLGYQAVGPTIMFASISGSIVGICLIAWRRNMNLKSSIPFGPFLAVGALIHLVFGSKIDEWLFELSR